MNSFIDDLKKDIKKIVDDENSTNLSNYREVLQSNIGSLPLLYRYVKADYSTIRSIETSNIKLISGSQLNDIFEAMPVFSDEIEKEMKNKKRGVLEDIADVHKIKSFTEDKNNLLMWSHYADSNKGMLFEYDISLLSEENQWLINHLYPIVYSDKRMSGVSIEQVVDDYFQYRKDSFEINDVPDENGFYNLYNSKEKLICLSIVKSMVWEEEKEWRISVPVIDLELEHVICDGIVNFDCMTAIYCGARMEKHVKEHIIEIVDKINSSSRRIKLYEMIINPNDFSLKASLIRPGKNP
jgi:hypothetical protein